jgi:TolA-binding protein
VNCERFRYWISLKADGRLDAPRADDLSAHLQSCAACRGFEDNLQKNKARLQALSSAPVSDAFAAEVMGAARSPRTRRRKGWLVPFAAAVILAAGLGAYVINRPKSNAPVQSAIRDRAWLLLEQAANESIERPQRFQSAMRDELAVARIPDPAPDVLKDAAEFLDRIRRFSQAAPATEDMKRLQDDIRSSGLLASWRPSGAPSSSDLILDTPTDPFRKARGLIYAGQLNGAGDQLREYLVKSPDPELQDDALYWLAFIEARRNREAEALGALYSLWAFEGQKWLDPPTIAEAQRLAMALGDAKGAARMEIPMWMHGGEESPPGWMTIDITPDEAWCAFEGARGNKGGKDSPIAVEVQGVTYEAKNLAEFKTRHPKILSFLQSKMPAVVKFFEEGGGEFEIQMDGEEP